MATEIKQTWGQRSKKTSVVALGLVAILAGIAVAYFLTPREYAGNRAVGGTLTVDATLPLDFSETTLYPTDADGSADTSDQSFTIDNFNTVRVKYSMFATCKECIEDPADTPEQAEARAKKIDQFNNLYIEIWDDPQSTFTEDSTTDSKCRPAFNGTTVTVTPLCRPYYKGRLADLKADNAVQLGAIDPEGFKPFLVKLWLKNDSTRAQPQGIENLWEFHINAQTPA